jgi:hypothetical protein
MATQNDLDRAMEQLEDLPAEALELYAYAAIKLLQERKSASAKQGSFDVCISESPQFSEAFQREIPTVLTAKISVSETVTGIE